MTETVTEGHHHRGAVGDPTEPGVERTRMVDRLDPTVVRVLTAVGFGLPLGVYLWMVASYSVNSIVSDQLSDLTVIGHSYGHLFDWSSLWAQHNENRILFPNLIVVALAHTTAFNIRIEEFLSAVMLIATTVLVIWSHKRRSPSSPWLFYCPVAFLALSVVQFGNAIWGFQMAWYLVLLALAVTIAFVDRIDLTWLAMAGAVVAGVVGSFSSLQGLLIWPAGLVLLYHRRRSIRFVMVWIIAAAVTVTVYFVNFDTAAGAPYHGYIFQNPRAAVKFYVFAVGDIVGVPQQNGGRGNNAVLLLGAVILVLAVATLVLCGVRRDARSGSPIGVALICVGLLFVLMVTDGRIIFGYPAASQSRYTTYDLLIPIGIFLALLGRWDVSSAIRRTRAGISGVAGGATVETAEPSGRGAVAAEAVRRHGIAVMTWLIGVVMVVQVVLGFHYGVEGARKDHAYQVRAVTVLRNFDRSSDFAVVYAVDVLGSPAFIRHQARIAQEHHLSVFSG